ncbi:hypothetical protein NC651_024786 [Populus alba x Populus x berolinensis]|nr:hypothetical protein NC651_024786 [Populus alba x Populus x berolinensis]
MVIPPGPLSDASSDDQDRNIRNRAKQKEFIESNNMKSSVKDKDLAEASSGGLKNSVQAKVPAMHVGRKEQLISHK